MSTTQRGITVIVRRLGLRLWSGTVGPDTTVRAALARAEREGPPQGAALAWVGPGWIVEVRGDEAQGPCDPHARVGRRQDALAQALRAQEARRAARGERAASGAQAEAARAAATATITFGRYETWERALRAEHTGAGGAARAVGRTARAALDDETMWTNEHAREVAGERCAVHIEVLRVAGQALRPDIGHPGLHARQAIVQRWRWEASDVTVVEMGEDRARAESDARAQAEGGDAWRTGDTEGPVEVVSWV